MENAIPYCGDLHIDAGTKKLILNLLGSIRSVVPVAEPPEPNRPEDDPGLNSLEYIRNVLVLARQHSGKLEGLFDPDELLRYSRYVADYQDIIIQMEKILKEMKICRNSALNFAGEMAELVEGHLRMSVSEAEDPDHKERKGKVPTRHDGIKLKVV